MLPKALLPDTSFTFSSANEFVLVGPDNAGIDVCVELVTITVSLSIVSLSIVSLSMSPSIVSLSTRRHREFVEVE